MTVPLAAPPDTRFCAPPFEMTVAWAMPNDRTVWVPPDNTVVPLARPPLLTFSKPPERIVPLVAPKSLTTPVETIVEIARTPYSTHPLAAAEHRQRPPRPCLGPTVRAWPPLTMPPVLITVPPLSTT